MEVTSRFKGLDLIEYLKNYGQRSLVGYSPWVRKELDLTEQLSTAQHIRLLSYFEIKIFEVLAK